MSALIGRFSHRLGDRGRGWGGKQQGAGQMGWGSRSGTLDPQTFRTTLVRRPSIMQGMRAIEESAMRGCTCYQRGVIMEPQPLAEPVQRVGMRRHPVLSANNVKGRSGTSTGHRSLFLNNKPPIWFHLCGPSTSSAITIETQTGVLSVPVRTDRAAKSGLQPHPAEARRLQPHPAKARRLRCVIRIFASLKGGGAALSPCMGNWAQERASGGSRGPRGPTE